jgi:peptidoglycan/xylan/chitin deacetylase (PgdA/CDA1 family)
VTNTFGSDSVTKTDYITVNEAPPSSSHAGVALTFDDDSVDQWFAIRDRLKNYDARVTFFVSGFASLSEAQVNKLKILKADGHEIAFHGLYHTDAQDYLQTYSINEYLNYEIIPGVELMKNQGLNPVDFSYPYGSENEALTEVLQGYFLHVRGTANSQDYLPLKEVDSIYYQYGSHQSHIYGIEIEDDSGGNSLDDIFDGILRAKEENKIVIFYAHTPVETEPQEYQLSYDRLDKILINVSENNLKFYTISELN